MSPLQTMAMGYVGLSLVWALTAVFAIWFWRREHVAKSRAAMALSFANSAEQRYIEAGDVIRSLEATIADTSRLLTDAQGTIATLEARLTLPEPTPADLVLLDAAARPERLQDAPVDVPEGCRVETVRYHAQTRVRGPGGKFVSFAKAGDSAPPSTTNYMGGGGGKGSEVKDNPVEPGSTITVTIGGEPEDCA